MKGSKSVKEHRSRHAKEHALAARVPSPKEVKLTHVRHILIYLFVAVIGYSVVRFVGVEILFSVMVTTGIFMALLIVFGVKPHDRM